MHRLLKVPEGETIQSKYKSAKKAVEVLIKATGDRAEAASMINFAANVAKGGKESFLKDMQAALKTIKK